MRFISTLVGIIVIATWSDFAAPLQAQMTPGESTGIIGTGSVLIERVPTVMRLQMMIEGQGKNVKEALSSLKAKEASAREKLQKLGVAEGGVKFTDAQPAEVNPQLQMQRMIQMRMGNAQRPAKNQPVVVTLSSILTAEWSLSGKQGDDLLVDSQDIADKVKAADLSGGTSDKQLTPEQQEIVEENQGAVANDGQPNPRDPSFSYVCKISDQDCDTARAAAYKKAREDAQRLAKAAGVELGSIRQIGGTAASAPAGDRSDLYSGMNPQLAMYYQMMQQQQQQPPAAPADAQEAIGTQPGKVGYRVTVYVSFAPKGG